MRPYGIPTVATALVLTLATPAQAQPRSDIVTVWFEQTVAAATATGNEISANRVWAISWLAAERALTTGHPIPTAERAAFEDAAVATAVHDGLVAQVPSLAGTLDDALEDSLDAVPDGYGKQAGVSAGHRAATRTLWERDGDGLDPASVNRPFPDPRPAPGVYRRPADAATPTQLAGLPEARSFFLDAADQFRPDPPPALGTSTYRRDLAEVRRYGSATSTKRTEEQTEVALLWAQSALAAYTAPLRTLITDQNRPLVWKTRLLAAYGTVTVDARIAIGDAKYAYLWWRPITAIRETSDPNWIPLRPTPAHPEYVSGHAGFAGAVEQVLEHFAGPRTPAPFTITNPAQGVSRDYARGMPWSALTQEVIDARVSIGAHYRTSDEVGATLGRQVADHAPYPTNCLTISDHGSARRVGEQRAQ